MLLGGRDPFSQGSSLLLSDAGQDVGNEIRDLTAFPDAVYRHPKRFEFLPTTHALQDPPSQAVKAKDHDDDRLSLGSQPSHIAQQRLVGGTIIALAERTS